MSTALRQLFEHHFGEPVEEVEPLRAHGSNRKLYRLSGRSAGAIGVEHADRFENLAFCEFAKHFHNKGLPVPKIYAARLEENIYLEEDLGQTTLFDLLSEKRGDAFSVPEEVVAYYRQTVKTLPEFQITAGRTLDYNFCYPRHTFDRQSMLWDLNYFKYYFLKLADIPFNEQSLEDDFGTFIDFLMSPGQNYFMYRDFQSRNIMIHNGSPHFIDFQGGRRGALQYDIASLLFDAKANLPQDLREQLLAEYLDAVGSLLKFDRERFLKYYPAFVLIRIMQALGAYGFRGFYERKSHFLQSVPFAVRNLEHLLDTYELPFEIPELRGALERIVQSTTLRDLTDAHLPLTVHISSFSYKVGLPKDDSGHGGGFVFDCRALPNPGRLEQYKDMTGNDREVIEYLERKSDVQAFLTRIQDLIAQVVDNYRGRNFTHLEVAFGCTGGQHRSVFCANRLADHLRSGQEIKVVLSHRELPRLLASFARREA